MSNYPHLTEMGILNPQEIEKFAIYSTDKLDVLRIIYQRKKGSLLPFSKNYKFPRVKKSVLVDSGTRDTALIFESTEAFRSALHELEALKVDKTKGDDLAALILAEIQFLEEDIALRTEYIKSLVGKI
jgi:Protein of unknown function (DUF3461)